MSGPLHRRLTWRPDRRDLGVAAVAAVVAVLLGYVLYTLDNQHAQIGALSSALTAQRAQAVQAGQSPVAPPPAQILATPTPVAGPKGDTGAAGRGLSSVVCVAGVWHVAYTDGSMDTDAGACTGPPGPIGPSGASVVGSPGPAGSTGPAGRDGQDGQGIVGPTGPPGPTGSTGANGQPPSSWTWTSSGPFSTTYRCTRDAGSPDSAPSYSCSPVESTPSP